MKTQRLGRGNEADEDRKRRNRLAGRDEARASVAGCEEGMLLAGARAALEGFIRKSLRGKSGGDLLSPLQC